MSARIRRLAAPASGGYLPVPGTNSSGTAAFTALANNINAEAPLSAAAGASGNILATAITFIPKVSGKMLISWSSSGNCSTSATSVAFTLNIEQTSTGVAYPAIQAGAGGDAGFTAQAASTVIASGWTVGTPLTINVAWAAIAGIYGPLPHSGGITVIELPF